MKAKQWLGVSLFFTALLSPFLLATLFVLNQPPAVFEVGDVVRVKLTGDSGVVIGICGGGYTIRLGNYQSIYLLEQELHSKGDNK